jgi:hypothetical protein
MPRTPMKTVNVELPDYVWTALKSAPPRSKQAFGTSS